MSNSEWIQLIDFEIVDLKINPPRNGHVLYKNSEYGIYYENIYYMISNTSSLFHLINNYNYDRTPNEIKSLSDVFVNIDDLKQGLQPRYNIFKEPKVKTRFIEEYSKIKDFGIF